MLKTPLISPILQIPPNSPYLDSLANLTFQVQCMSPEECTPLFSPQIYAIDNEAMSDTEFPEVSAQII
jgi:hypothetical protein